MAKVNPWKLFRIAQKDKSVTDFYAVKKELPPIKPSDRGIHHNRTTRFIGAIPEMTNE